MGNINTINVRFEGKMQHSVASETAVTKESILKNVRYQLVGNNKFGILSYVPHRKKLDFAITYSCVAKSVNGDLKSVMVTHELANSLNISADELEKAAMNNTVCDGFSIAPIEEVIADEFGANIPSGANPMLVASNPSRFLGASIILFESMLNLAAKSLREDLFVIPSSIHEVLLVPASYADARTLKEMLREVNDTTVANRDILGYNIYFFNSDTKTLSIAKQ